jgi:hypothetical protein
MATRTEARNILLRRIGVADFILSLQNLKSGYKATIHMAESCHNKFLYIQIKTFETGTEALKLMLWALWIEFCCKET